MKYIIYICKTIIKQYQNGKTKNKEHRPFARMHRVPHNRSGKKENRI